MLHSIEEKQKRIKAYHDNLTVNLSVIIIIMEGNQESLMSTCILITAYSTYSNN